jgi:uncharacterized membrane protein YsdA (DUF1294 family)
MLIPFVLFIDGDEFFGLFSVTLGFNGAAFILCGVGHKFIRNGRDFPKPILYLSTLFGAFGAILGLLAFRNKEYTTKKFLLYIMICLALELVALIIVVPEW